MLEQYGIAMASYHLYQLGSGSVKTIAYGHPKDFENKYISQGWGRVDPIHQYAISNGGPFRWRDIHKLTKLSPEQERFLEFAQQSGLTDGVAFGVYGPKLRHAFVGLGFGPGTPEPTKADADMMQLICQTGHIRYCEMVDDIASVSLSPRESETLKWMSIGKSNADIASIMGVSPHTIDTHVRRLYAKLGASDRTTASLKGFGTGVLQCSELVTQVRDYRN